MEFGGASKVTDKSTETDLLTLLAPPQLNIGLRPSKDPFPTIRTVVCYKGVSQYSLLVELAASAQTIIVKACVFLPTACSNGKPSPKVL